ncbi:Retrovirus-related Pol polyprotein from transposon TNT 1-94 [Porphyridium purpureum]|uniref:Retrovirus-related Pol polyprotein from transposon TNT 1-94 n=1 Tax=Porphyridium purpureum TaxID=35688 RepID=A0A5J4YPM5_PORPP|nr:Retrovirus-related Pol polyprotein from transposon TNT 1-94 [Porphyridium purpureum]|eukprot:POR0774..scf236_6
MASKVVPCHDLMHLPKDPACGPCQTAKLRRTSSWRSGDQAVSRSVLELDLVDAGGDERGWPRRGARYLMVALDHPDRWLAVEPLMSKSSDPTAEALERILAGEAWPSVIKTDDGREFSGAFARTVLKHGARHEGAVPRRPNTHAPVESMNRTLLGAVRTTLVAAGLPLRFWEDAALSFAFAWNRAERDEVSQKSPYEVRYKKKFAQEKLLPFGCAIMYLDEEAAKFESRSRLGIFIKYHEETRIVVVDSEELARGRAREIVTRDYVPKKIDYPARRLGLRPLGEQLWLEDFGQEHNNGDHAAYELCGKCGKRKVLQIRCLKCLGKRGKRHRKDDSCTLGACRCTPTEILEHARKVAARAEHQAAQFLETQKSEQDRLARAKAAAEKGERRAQCAKAGASSVQTSREDKPYKRWACGTQSADHSVWSNCQAAVKARLRRYHCAPDFVRLPEELPESKEGVFRLRRALYGLERSGADFIIEVTRRLNEQGWKEAAPSLFAREKATLAAYVDDFLLAGPADELSAVERSLRQMFTFDEASERLSCGEINFLGIKVRRAQGFIEIDHTDYAKWVGTHTSLCAGIDATTPDVEVPAEDYDSVLFGVDAPRAQIGALLWLSRTTRPEISRAVARAARFLDKWNIGAQKILDRCLSYLRGKKRSILRYPCGSAEGESCADVCLKIYSDSDFAGDSGATCKSTSGMVVFIEIRQRKYLIDWSSRAQRAVSTSSAEAEVIALSQACKVSLGLAPTCELSGQGEAVMLDVYTDSQAALKAVEKGYSAKLAHARRTQRVSIAWLHELAEDGLVRFRWIRGTENPADLFTKTFSRPQFDIKLKILGLGDDRTGKKLCVNGGDETGSEGGAEDVSDRFNILRHSPVESGHGSEQTRPRSCNGRQSGGHEMAAVLSAGRDGYKVGAHQLFSSGAGPTSQDTSKGAKKGEGLVQD